MLVSHPLPHGVRLANAATAILPVIPLATANTAFADPPFPSEILLEVLKYLPLNKSWRTLAHFAQTSKTWHVEASALLWRDIPATAVIWCSVVDYYTTPGTRFDQKIDSASRFVNLVARNRQGVIKFRFRALEFDMSIVKAVYGNTVEKLCVNYHRFVTKYAKYVCRVEFHFPALYSASYTVNFPVFPRGTLSNLAAVSVVYGGRLGPSVQLCVRNLIDACINRPLRSLTMCSVGERIESGISIDWISIELLLKRVVKKARQLTTLQLLCDFKFVYLEDQAILLKNFRRMESLRTLELMEGIMLKEVMAEFLDDKEATMTFREIAKVGT